MKHALAFKVCITLIIMMIYPLSSTMVAQERLSGEFKKVINTSRKIEMRMALNLKKNNHHTSSILNTLNYYDEKLRNCYSTKLSEKPNLHGTMVFKIETSEDTGAIHHIKRTGGSLADQDIEACLVEETKQVPLPIRHKMLGELTFLFNVYNLSH